MTFTVKRIDHVVLRARDVAALTRFYTAVLGATVERELPDIGLVQIRAGDSLLDLVPARDDAAGRNMDHLCFRIEPFDEGEIRARLAPFGVAAEPAARRYGADGYGPSVYFHDPEGNRIEFKGGEE